MSATAEQRREELVAWVRTCTGEDAATIRVRPGGGRNVAYDVVDGDGTPRWFLRTAQGRPDPGEHYTLRREAAIYAAVHAIGLPSPAVLGVHPEREAVLLERMPGDPFFAPLAPDVQTAIIDDFAPQLARLHAADPASLDLPGLVPARTVDEAVRNELDIWEQRLDASGTHDAFLTACFRWLRANLPTTGEQRPSLVQGDTGPGNFLHDGAARVTAFLDFELGHLGDPMEDLAWVGTRNAQEPVPDFERFLSHYAAAASTPIDRDRIRYHALFAELRICVLGAGRGEGEIDLLGEHGNHIIYGALHRRLTVEALAAAAGVPMPDMTLPALADTDQTRYFDGLLAQMAQIVVPAIDDPYPKRRAKSMARMLKYLREADRAGDSHLTAELDEQEALLGFRPASVHEGAEVLHTRVRDGSLDAVALLPHAAAQALRRQQLAAQAMGVLATRHLPVL